MDSPTSPPIIVNPLLDRIQMPGETFTLPSGGTLYDPDVLTADVKNAEIRVHPMTAIDEIIMKTPDMLFSGDAVRDVFKRCIPQVNNIDKMFAKDVDFLLVCLRKVSYGDELHIEYTHTCKNAKSHKYTVDVSTFIKTTKRMDPTTVVDDFTLKLPNAQVVKMQPLSYAEFIRLMQTSDKNLSPEELKTIMVNSLSSVIKAVDEITDVGMIREWLGRIRPAELKKINEKIDNSVKWGSEFGAKLTCKDCEQPMVVETPMNPLSFFT